VSRFLTSLTERVLIADGAMGSMIHLLADPGFHLPDQVNLTQPDCVLGVHVRYLRAGARLIETNSFGANRLKLERFGLAEQVISLNQRAVKIAREAREIASVDAFIGGAMGPSGLRIRPGAELERRLFAAFREQAAALEDRGVDVYVLETFQSRWELEVALAAVRSASSLPVIAQMTLPASDEWTDHEDAAMDEEVIAVLDGLASLPADVIGLNCTLGPGQMLPALQRLAARAPGRTLSVQPNTGLPQRADGRFVYPETSAAWYARFARQAVEAGARILGGCCGTTPEQIAAMADAVGSSAPAHITVEPVHARPIELLAPDAEARASGLAARLARGEFTVSMQVDPPKGTRADMVLEAVRAFRDSGHVHVVDVNSNPMARLHMDALWLSAMIEAEGMETIAHYTPRDASLMGLEGNLLGAWNYGVRNVLVITGDPSVVNGEPGAADVYQTDSIGMVRTLHQLNQGQDCFGHTVGSAPGFFLGVAVNPNHENLDLEVERFRQKVDAGARFAMTQVFFEWSCWERFLDRLGGTCPIPVLVAVWPLTSLNLAVRLHHEVPGIVVPKDVLERLDAAGPHARREGFALAREMLQESRHRAAGAYVIAPFKRPTAALELFTPE
jgi:methionine synthase I (cobalamin-dependent)/5,10-methylenetetrahydrofolate reductase